jgi:hypothetical protein
MGGTTSPLAFPYPTGTDRVADGDNAIQALAEAIDDNIVGANTAILLQPNVIAWDGGSMASRRGRTVHIRLGFQIQTTFASTQRLLTVPAAYCPAVRCRFLLWNNTAGGVLPFYVDPDGGLAATPALTTANWQFMGSASYPLGSQAEGPAVADET